MIKSYKETLHSVELQNFFVTQILREIKVVESRVSKSKAWNFDFSQFLYSLKAENDHIINIHSPKNSTIVLKYV